MKQPYPTSASSAPSSSPSGQFVFLRDSNGQCSLQTVGGTVLASFEVIWKEYLAFTWLEFKGREYFLCNVDDRGEKLIVDLEAGHVHGWRHAFLWNRFLPSPDGRLLAIEGGYWACPEEVVVYDLFEPLRLEGREVFQFQLGELEDLHWAAPRLLAGQEAYTGELRELPVLGEYAMA